MIIKIESAKPILSTKPSAKDWNHYVKHWYVQGFTWDGKCMCTKKPINIKIDWPSLVITRNELNRLVRDKIP